MAFPTSVNDQITDAVTQAHSAGGEQALSIITELMTEIAKGLKGAQQGHNTIEDISVAFENAEMAFHDLVAKLASDQK